MINYYLLSDATPVALFGMFALWAAASKRHWFVRTAVVGGALLVALLIPAFEVVMLLSVECLLVVAGIAIWRRRRRRPTATSARTSSSAFRLQLSMQTLMLAVVIVAVVTAVVTRAPQLTVEQWYRFVFNGVTAAATCLTCVWIVCGRSRWWIRLAAAPILPFVLALTFHALRWAGNLINQWSRVTNPLTSFYDFMQAAMRDTYGLWFFAKATVLGMVILCAWLLLVRRAKWFDPFEELDGDQPQTQSSRRQIAWARVGAVALFGAAAVFPLALFYRLMTPTPIPQIELPNPNGFDHFVAAGKMIGPAVAAKLSSVRQLSSEALGAELAKHSAAFERMRDGLKKPTLHPYIFQQWVQEDLIALRCLQEALFAQQAFIFHTGNKQERLENALLLLRLAHAESRGMATFSVSFLGTFESVGHNYIMELKPLLSSEESQSLAAELWSLDRNREPWEVRAERQRIIDENAGWKSHVRSILQEWNGGDMYEGNRTEFERRVAEMRVLIVELGIRAYQLDNNRLTASLAELVPKHLPGIPDDPYGEGPIKYKRSDDAYTLYCSGPDGDDDGGKTIVDENGEPNGDITMGDLFPYLRQSAKAMQP
ncbi:MAG: hypothetical protein L0228_21420 [Planctomycetes bacterium]|nr:hypothetical protein [Planctomycetota bacterium]